MGTCPSGRRLMRKRGGGGRIWRLAVPRPLGPAHSPLALSGSASPKLYSIWNSLLGSRWGRVISCVALPLKASSQGNQGSLSLILPLLPSSLLSHHFFVPSTVSPPFCISWPPGSVSTPPPLCLSSATAVSSPACLGRSPAVLPGHPPWLPLCGSELAPPPAPPPPRGLGLL